MQEFGQPARGDSRRAGIHPIFSVADRPSVPPSSEATVTIWYIDIMWGLALFGVAAFSGACLVFNPAVRAIRTMSLLASYGIGLYMLIALPPAVAAATWCVFAAFGGVVAFGYELWARHRYAGTGRRRRPLVLLQGFLLWPAMIPDAIEGALVDLGILDPSGPAGEEKVGLMAMAKPATPVDRAP